MQKKLYCYPKQHQDKINVSTESTYISSNTWLGNIECPNSEQDFLIENVRFNKPVNVQWSGNTVSTNDITESIIRETTNEIIINAENVIIRNCFFDASTATNNNVIFDNSTQATSGSGIYLYQNNLITNYSNFYESEQSKLKNRFKKHLAPAIINHKGMYARSANAQNRFNNTRPEELIALQLLRRMVPRDVFKKYLKHGFVTIEGPSGLTYQITRKHHNIKVWKQGQLISELCVYLKDKTIPPTDEVVAKMIIVECDEIDIWRRANIYWKSAVSEFRQLTRKTIEERHLRLVA